MKRLYVLVEGQTEETFIKSVLAPFYNSKKLFITPILVQTSYGHKGGLTTYAKIKPQIMNLCKKDRQALVSTFFDLYALPKDFPGKSTTAFPSNGTGIQKAIFLENQLSLDINHRNFVPYLMVYEFEALLFSQPGKISTWIDDQKAVEALVKIKQSYETPEHINDDPNTAPSKRIKKIMPGYKKTLHGPIIVEDIGLETLQKNCQHFNEWLIQLEKFTV